MSLKGKKKLFAPTTKNRLSKSVKGQLKEDKSNENLTESKTKKIWSAEALTDAMKPSSEELNFRKEKSQENGFVKKSKKLFRCTKCLLNFNPITQKHKKVPIHPALGVLMCKKCCDFYEDGEFSLDSEGEDKYCRWCGEGGTIFVCAKCICGFCASCIKQHLGIVYFKNVQKDDNWLCFFCNPKPLWTLRYICSLAVQASEGIKMPEADSNSNDTGGKDVNIEQSSSSESLTKEHSLNSKVKILRKRLCISSSEDSEDDAQESLQKKLKLASSDDSSSENKRESFEKKKSDVLKDLEKVLKLSKYHLRVGVNWSNRMLKKVGSSDFLPTNKQLVKECRKIKWFLSLLSTHLVQFCNSVNSLEKSLISDDGVKISSEVTEKNQSPYITILQFLGFINSQIKTFMEKGITLSDILEAGVYDNDSIKGIREKLKFSNSSYNLTENINCQDSQINCTPSENEGLQNSEDLKQKFVSEGLNRNEISSDVFGDNNSEMNSTECGKEGSSSNITGETQDINTSDPKEDIQEILAILENA